MVVDLFVWRKQKQFSSLFCLTIHQIFTQIIWNCLYSFCGSGCCFKWLIPLLKLSVVKSWTFALKFLHLFLCNSSSYLYQKMVVLLGIIFPSPQSHSIHHRILSILFLTHLLISLFINSVSIFSMWGPMTFYLLSLL